MNECEKLVKTLDNEKVIECLDLRDGDGKPLNDPQLVEFLSNIYNQAVDNCKKAIEEYFQNESK